ncbi:hypothetical protein BGZ76_002604 [Entomortierella beljakovae]|nr:hypothetical protein BGZ76_002604 [Entomortierella beljakovae]
MGGYSSASNSRPRPSSSKPGPSSPVTRKGNNTDYFDQSPHDTETMLTCWGTDSSNSEDEDEEEEKSDASDGDGEWEESSSESDYYDEGVNINSSRRRGASIANAKGASSPGNPFRTIDPKSNDFDAVAQKMFLAKLDSAPLTSINMLTTVDSPTVVPQYLKERYSTQFYGSGDLESGCLEVYNSCCSRLETLLSFESEKARGGSIVIMSGEGMVALWGGMKSVIPWPFHYDQDGVLKPVSEENSKFKILCVSNGVYGSWMLEMVKSLRYSTVEVKVIESEWNRPVNVEAALATIEEWKPDLITMVHCDTPTGALNSETVCAIGEACSKTDTLFYVDIVSSAGAVPVDISGWNIDIGLIGSQKAFSCEPSFAALTVSAKAWKQIEKVGYTGYDALLQFKGAEKTGLPYTPLWSALDAFDYQLKTTYGENNELVQQVYDRHEQVAKYCRERVQKMGLTLWWDKEHASLSSPSVTAIRVPDNTTWEELNKKLRKEGVVFGGRVGHMGSQANLETVAYAMDVLEKIVNQK